MIWIIGIVIVVLVVGFLLLDWHLGGLRQQTSGVAQLLGMIVQRLDRIESTLAEIERDTDKLPKVEAHRFDEY